MSCTLTRGRLEIACYDNIGGIKKIFLFPFVEYTHLQILGTRGKDLTTFPATDIYEFDITNGSMSESIDNTKEGLSYNQTTSFVLKKQDQDTTFELKGLSELELRYIVKFNDGNHKIGGLFNAASLEFEMVSGGSKNELPGYNITISGKEEWQSAFIDDLSSTGFTISNHLLLEDYDDLLLDDGSKLILE